MLQSLLSLLTEVLFVLPGHLIAGWFRPTSEQSLSGCLPFILSLGFWTVIGFAIYGMVPFF